MYCIYKMVDLKKAKKHLEAIMAKFEKAGGVYLFYDFNREPFRPLVIANSEKDVEEKMNAKLAKDPEKYENAKLVRVYISANPKNLGKTKYSPGIGGAFGIGILEYFITSKKRVGNRMSDGVQNFWYTDEQLVNRKFSTKDIKRAMDAVVNKKLKTHIFRIYDMSALDDLRAKKKSKKPSKTKKKKKTSP